MMKKKQMTLAQLPEGQSGTVVQIQGGNVLAKRLEDMGIRQGKTITKQSAMMFHGPVTILVDRAQVALGYGMASAILLEVDATSFRIEKVEG